MSNPHDYESLEPLITSNSKSKNKCQFNGIVLSITGICIGALCITFVYLNTFSKPQYSLMSFKSKKTGKQEVHQHCINLYGSNYHEYDNTIAFIVCKDDDFDSVKINDCGFSKDDSNHGISYIETGDYAWLTIYEKENFEGESYVIPPNSVVDLRFIELKGSNPYKKSWNDNIRSLITAKKQKIMISPINEKQDSKVGEYCFNLYGSSPLIIKDTKGFEICGDRNVKREWWYSYQDLIDLGDNPQHFAKGISYIEIGSKAEAIIYNGKDFDGAALKLKPGSKTDLRDKFINKESGLNWNDRMHSLILIFPESEEEKKQEMFFSSKKKSKALMRYNEVTNREDYTDDEIAYDEHKKGFDHDYNEIATTVIDIDMPDAIKVKAEQSSSKDGEDEDDEDDEDEDEDEDEEEKEEKEEEEEEEESDGKDEHGDGKDEHGDGKDEHGDGIDEHGDGINDHDKQQHKNFRKNRRNKE